MRACEIHGSFGLDKLEFVERPSVKVLRTEVRVRVRAVSLNYRDYLTVIGQYNPKQPLPLVPCSDGAGEVIEVGSDVRDVRVGDRVVSLFCQDWQSGEPTLEKLRSTLGGPRQGVLAEEIVLPSRGVVRFPDRLSFEQAATLPCAALTAWSALEQCGVRPGDAVLIQGTGGVSLFALQLARVFGARPIVMSKSAEKIERAKRLGAFGGFSYVETPAWGKRAREIAGGAGVDAVIEVGGKDTLEESLRAVRVGGTIAIIGVLGGAAAPVSLPSILMNQVRLQGVLVGHREQMERMLRAMDQENLEPVIDHVAPWERASDELLALTRGEHFGKVVLAVG